MFTVR